MTDQEAATQASPEAMKYYFKCPKGGSNEQFVKPLEESDGIGFSLFFFGGIIPALLFAEYKQQRVQCCQCSCIFKKPALPRNPNDSFPAWMLGLTFFSFLLAAVFYIVPELAGFLPAFPVLSNLEHIVSEEPRVTIYLMALLFVLIVVPSWVIVCLSNAKFRKQFASEHRVDAPRLSRFSSSSRPQRSITEVRD